MARSPGPATAMALRMPWLMSYVSTSSVVFLPSAATWDVNAAGSSSCSSVNACALVPAVGMPYRPPAARFDVEAKPAYTYTLDDQQVAAIEEEVKLAREIGLPASLASDTGPVQRRRLDRLDDVFVDHDLRVAAFWAHLRAHLRAV